MFIMTKPYMIVFLCRSFLHVLFPENMFWQRFKRYLFFQIKIVSAFRSTAIWSCVMRFEKFYDCSVEFIKAIKSFISQRSINSFINNIYMALYLCFVFWLTNTGSLRNHSIVFTEHNDQRIEAWLIGIRL